MRLFWGSVEAAAIVLGAAGILAFGMGAGGAIVIPLLIAPVVAMLIKTFTGRA